MTVRRLHSEQPASFAFTPENLSWAKEQIVKYPEGRQASAVLPLLWRAQEQEGWLSEPAIRAVADMLSMANIRVYEVATFYTMFQLAPVGSKAHVQVCGTTPCMLRGSLDLIAVCKERIGANPRELSEDGAFSWEEVECLGSCANAPMVQIGADTFEDLTPDLLHGVIDGYARGNLVPAGSRTGRVASCPAAGPTTLKEFIPAEMVEAAVEAVTSRMPVTFGVRSEDRPMPAPQGDGAVGSGLALSHMVVGDESVGDMLRPDLFPEPRNGKADDLRLIHGIGPLLEKMLNELGVWHYEQIASWRVQQLKWIDQQLEDFRGRAERDRWVEQARRLATGWRPEKDSGGKPKG